MELRHLRYFVAVAEERHFGRAAERLHMAQPPLSQQIRRLEADLGVTLLRRTTRRVELTDAGSVYLDQVRRILSAVEEAGAEAQRVEAGLSGRLSVGCVGSATYSLLPALARTLREQRPGLDVSFHGEMLVPDQVTALLGGEIDLALLRPPVDGAGLDIRQLRAERLIVVLPEGHPLCRRRRLRVHDLREQDLLMHPSRGRSTMYRLVTTLCREQGFSPRVRQEVAETSTLLTFVAAGLGVAIVPETVAVLGVPGTVYRPLAGAGARVDLSAATRTGDDSAAVATALRVLETLV